MCGSWAYLLHNQVVFDNKNNLNDYMSIQDRGPDDFHVSYYKYKYATQYGFIDYLRLWKSTIYIY